MKNNSPKNKTWFKEKKKPSKEKMFLHMTT